MSTSSVSFAELQAAATPAATVDSQVTTTATEPQVPAIPQFTEADAQSLRDLNALGINPQNAQHFVQAKQALENLPGLLKANPRAVLGELAKNDSDAYNAILEASSDEWFEKYQREHPEEFRQATNGSPSRTATSVPDPRLNKLEQQLASIIARDNQREAERQQSAMLTGFNNTVNGLIGQLPKEVSLTASDKEYIELKTQRLIYLDPVARDRVAKGIFVDVPKYFAQACNARTADIKAAANTEHANRQRVEANGSRTIVPAAENVNGTQAGPQEDSIWGDVGIAKDVAAALKAMK